MKEIQLIHTSQRKNNGTRRIQYDCSEPLITDQSSAKEADVNNIMALYQKNGTLPQTSIPGEYRDNTGIPSLEEAFRIAKNAQDAFYRLPPTVRKLVDNDPSQLENLIADPKFADILIKEGVLIARSEPVKPPESTLSKVQPPEIVKKD